jgi:O-antigen/teichoic acid export membrane protein
MHERAIYSHLARLRKVVSLSNVPSRFHSFASVVFTTFAVQGLSFVSSILIIRYLSIQGYALFTIANLMASLLNALADSGLSSAALAIGGRHHGDTRQLGSLLASCRAMLWTNGALALAAVAPLWLWSSWKHSTSIGQLTTIGVCLVLGFLTLLGVNIYRSLLLLHHQLHRLQFWDVACIAGRIVLMLTVLRYFPFAEIAVAIGFLAEIPRLFVLRRLSHTYAAANAPATSVMRTEIKQILKRTVPTTIYGALSTQVQFLLLALFGSTTSVASAGALSRLHQFFMVVPAYTATVLSPNVAKERCLARVPIVFTKSVILGLSLCAVVAGVIILAPKICLWPLGPKYSGYLWEARMIALGSGIYTATGVIAGLLAARGNIVPPTWSIAANISALAFSISFLPVDQLTGFLWMQLLVNLAGFCATAAFGVVMWRRLPIKTNA